MSRLCRSLSHPRTQSAKFVSGIIGVKSNKACFAPVVSAVFDPAVLIHSGARASFCIQKHIVSWSQHVGELCGKLHLELMA